MAGAILDSVQVGDSALGDTVQQYLILVAIRCWAKQMKVMMCNCGLKVKINC